MLAKAALNRCLRVLWALGTFLGLVVGVAVGGGGIALAGTSPRFAPPLLAFLGWAVGALALALVVYRAAARGGDAVGGRGARIPPQRLASCWGARRLKYRSLFYYYEGHDPIANGVDTGDSPSSPPLALAHGGRGRC